VPDSAPAAARFSGGRSADLAGILLGPDASAPAQASREAAADGALFFPPRHRAAHHVSFGAGSVEIQLGFDLVAHFAFQPPSRSSRSTAFNFRSRVPTRTAAPLSATRPDSLRLTMPAGQTPRCGRALPYFVPPPQFTASALVTSGCGSVGRCRRSKGKPSGLTISAINHLLRVRAMIAASNRTAASDSSRPGFHVNCSSGRRDKTSNFDAEQLAIALASDVTPVSSCAAARRSRQRYKRVSLIVPAENRKSSARGRNTSALQWPTRSTGRTSG